MAFWDEFVKKLKDWLRTIWENSHKLLKVNDTVTIFVEQFVHHSCLFLLEVTLEETLHYGKEL